MQLLVRKHRLRVVYSLMNSTVVFHEFSRRWMQARSVIAQIFKEIEVAILMLVESGYDSSSGTERRNEFRVARIREPSTMLDKSRTLHLEAIQQGDLYRESGIWKFGNINGKTLARMKFCSAFRNFIATKMLPSHKTYHLRVTQRLYIFFKILLFLLKFKENLEMMEFWKINTQHFMQRLRTFEGGRYE